MVTKQHVAPSEDIYSNTFIIIASLQQLMSQDKTKKSTPTKPSTYKYRKYDFKKRNRLIEMVEKQKKSLASARLIMKTWGQEGRVFQKKVDRIKREKKEALKQSQARKKEKQRLKKLARKQQTATQVPQQPRNQIFPQQARIEIKVQQNHPPIIQEQRTAILPQIPFDPTVTYNPLCCQASYFFIYPQAPYY